MTKLVFGDKHNGFGKPLNDTFIIAADVSKVLSELFGNVARVQTVGEEVLRVLLTEYTSYSRQLIEIGLYN